MGTLEWKASQDFLAVAGNVRHNLSPAELVEAALVRGEGVLASNGALRVVTGKYTGRSPHDKFVVDLPSVHDEIAWGTNAPIDEAVFDALYKKMLGYAQNKEVFVFDGIAGADQESQLRVRFVNEFAWQNLFVHQLFIRPEEKFDAPEDFTVICMPGFKAVPAVDGTNSEAFVLVHLEKNVILIGGTSYAGEMKKSIFSIMNYRLPKAGILSMHCSANVGKDGTSALFFGLSGTGKTTLSADPNRCLIGDDEHGWSDNGIFNIEGGCYAKCIHLSEETEPQIWNAVKFGAVVENVSFEEGSRVIDFDNGTLTENTRAAYPITSIPNAVLEGKAGHPKAILFLTADAFGVLPPISKLTKEQAMYQFLSGYTSKLAGTERGITEPQATFSTCFGQPFLPLSPLVYANLLGEKMEKHNTAVYLVNTGWSGGPYGVGKRMKLSYTRAMITAALEGKLDDVEWVLDPIFNVYVPQECENVPAEILTPRNTWADKDAYDAKAKELADAFNKNFEKFKDEMPEAILNAGPKYDK